MPQENVDIVRRGLEASMRRPKPDFAKMNEVYHPNHEFISRIDAIEGGSHIGGRGYRSWLLQAEEGMEWESKLERITEISDDQVLAVIPTRFRGRSSGVTLDWNQMACIMTVRGGKILRTEIYRSPEEALDALGLAE